MSDTQLKVSGGELIVSRLLNAPRSLVFEVWTNPVHVVKWWGPIGFTTTSKKMNVTAGGEWFFTMHGPDGRDYLNKIIFLEVVKPEKLVYRHAGDEGTEDVRFKVTITFEEKGDKTLLTMRSVFDTAEELQRVDREFGAIEGARQHIGRLDEYLSQHPPFIIERTYNVSSEKVWKAITDKDAMKKWYFDLKEFRAEPGFQFSFEGGPDDGVKYLHNCTIKEVIPGKKLSYSWRYQGYEGDSLVSFELFPDGNKTKLRLTHAGLETFPSNIADFARKNFEMGWTEIINSLLRKYLERSDVTVAN